MKKSDAQRIGEKMNQIDTPLIQTNDQKNFIKLDGRQGPPKLSRKLYTQLCPLSVIDKETLKLIQVLRLHTAIDHTVSVTGAAVLLRSLVQPSTDLLYIRSKQESLKEIASNAKLRKALQDFVHEYRQGESALYKFLNKDLYAISPYRDLKKARQSSAAMVKMHANHPQGGDVVFKGIDGQPARI